MKRRAFTLAEILVVVSISVAIFASAWMIFHFSNRSRGVTATANALQTALLLQEHFLDDLGRLLPGASLPVLVRPDQPGRISFYAYDAQASTPDKLVINPVVYSVDAAKRVHREWKRKRDPIGFAPFESLEFVPFVSPTGPLIRVTMVIGRAEGEPAGPSTTHSFLARIPTAVQHPALSLSAGADFLDPKDEPGDGSLPGP